MTNKIKLGHEFIQLEITATQKSVTRKKIIS
jgi:hypothetical protein